MMTESALVFQKTYTQQVSLKYLQSLPEEYGKDPEKRWPLILFLHGGGERGDDLEMVKKHGIPRLTETTSLPFITLSPQCPVHHWWADYLPALDDLLTYAINTLRVDPRRIYLTGLSMGGYGTWHMAVEYPQRFAAIAPICGGGHWSQEIYDRILAIKHVPVWAFHGAKDRVVPPRESKWLVKALQKGGGNAKLTIYPDTAHESWTQTYENPELFEWFLSHQKEA